MTTTEGPDAGFAPPHYLRRKRGTAEIDRPPSGAEDDARDLKATSLIAA